MNTVFKICFWLCMVVVNLLVIGLLTPVFLYSSGDNRIFGMIIASIGLFFHFVYMILVPIIIAKDAKSRGMDYWMWAFIATFAPNFIGIIVYFIVRAKKPLQKSFCAACGKPLQDEFTLCPYCGNTQYSCKNCGKHLEHDWKVCPYCGTQQ